MYLQHFGLREAPFGVASDRRFTFFGKEHREAISSLYVGILEGRGISAIVGRPGMGKTTLANYLLSRLKTKAVTCCLDYPFRRRSDLMCGILSELGLDGNEDRDFRQVKLLEAFCAEKSQEGRKTVLFVDEAQALSLDSLEQIRLLSNLRSNGKAVLEIVLAGHPCLADAIRARRNSNRCASVSAC
jgi:type II secretory pathway predicted ATPase ExeA